MSFSSNRYQYFCSRIYKIIDNSKDCLIDLGHQAFIIEEFHEIVCMATLYQIVIIIFYVELNAFLYSITTAAE